MRPSVFRLLLLFSSTLSTHDSVSTEEVEENCSRGLNLPRRRRPSSQDGGDERSSFDVDVFGEEEGEIVGTGDGVCRDVGTRLSEHEGCCNEKGCCSVGPESDDLSWVPESSSVDDLRSGGNDDTDEREASVGDGDKENLAKGQSEDVKLAT